MKKLLTMAAVITVAASMAYAASNEVYSVNIVGFQKVDLPPDLSMIAVPFEVSGSLDEVIGIAGNAGANPDSADLIYLYDGSYKRYFLYDGSIPGLSYTGWCDGGTYAQATNVFLEPGMSFFYKNYSLTDVETNVLVGDVVMDEATTNQVLTGLQLLSYPFSCDVILSDLSFVNGTAGDNPDNSDLIYTFINGTYKRYFLYDGSIPGLTYTGWCDGGTYALATNVNISAGQGFWYKAKSNFEWIESRPYLND